LEGMDEEEGNLLTVSQCSHTFHMHCIARWKEVSRKCPCCRGPLPDDIGPTFSRLMNIPAEGVSSDMTRCAIFVNVIFCPVGIVYPLLLLSLFLAFGTICFGIFVILILFLSIYAVFDDEENHFSSAICISIVLCIMSPFFAYFLVAAYTVQIFYALYRTLKFYVNVFMCNMRWSSAYSFIIQRTITVTSYLMDIDNWTSPLP